MTPVTIICDTREALPLDFSKKRGISVVRKGLKTGDYSVQGWENQICFERKSIPDLIGTLIGGHERFGREVERMKSYAEKYILVEHTPSIAYEYCKRHGWQRKYDTAIQTLFGYAYRVPVRIVWCKDRDYMVDYIVDHVRKFVETKGVESEKKTSCC